MQLSAAKVLPAGQGQHISRPCWHVSHVACPQPLFIQTPLQVMLETLVEKLQLQADVIGSLQDRVREAGPSHVPQLHGQLSQHIHVS
jgi:hypothetical protein